MQRSDYMTDFNQYSEFLKGSIFRPSKKENDLNNKGSNLKNKTLDNKKSWHKAKKETNHLRITSAFKPTIDIGDVVELLYIKSGERIKVKIFDNYMRKEVRFNDSPKSNRGTKAFISVPDKITEEDSLSVLTELYNLIKYKKTGDIIEYKEEKIQILSIKKAG